MRFPFPERVSYSGTFVFGTALAGCQLLEGSNPAMVGLVFCFILVSAAAFNMGGGMYRCAGAFIGSNAIMSLVLPMVVKVILDEPAQRNLLVPVKTVEVYLAGMISLLVAAILSKALRKDKALISDMISPSDTQAAYRGAMIFSYLLGTLQVAFTGGGNGSLFSFLGQVNKFPALTFLLGVISTVQASKGRTSFTWPLFFFTAYAATAGLYTFSKEAFLAPFFCWAIAAAYMQFRLTKLNIVAFSFGLYLTAVYMVPYAQVGRLQTMDGASPIQTAKIMLSNLDGVREQYRNLTEDTYKYHDYDTSLGLLDRLDVFAVDDALVDFSTRNAPYGYAPIVEGFENFIPHLLWPSKPVPYFGNVFGHEIGLLAGNDNSTGISFGYASDAYREGGFFAIFLILPLIFTFIFVVLDRVVGDTRLNPVGLILTALICRVASEGMMTGAINLTQQPMIAVVLVAVVTKYLLPPMGRFFFRPKPLNVQELAPAQTLPAATSEPLPIV